MTSPKNNPQPAPDIEITSNPNIRAYLDDLNAGRLTPFEGWIVAYQEGKLVASAQTEEEILQNLDRLQKENRVGMQECFYHLVGEETPYTILNEDIIN